MITDDKEPFWMKQIRQQTDLMARRAEEQVFAAVAGLAAAVIGLLVFLLVWLWKI